MWHNKETEKKKREKKGLKELPRKNSILMESVKRSSEDRQPVISDTTKDGSLSVNFSTPKVRIMPSFKQNLAELKGYGRTAPKENKAKIEEIIDLYERKKIPNFRAAENAVIRLNQKSKNAARSKRAELEYEKVVAKYRDAQPITGRLNRELDKKRKSSEILAGITMILFRVKDRSGEKQEVTVNVDGVGGEGAKQDMREIGKKVKNELTNKNNKRHRGGFRLQAPRSASHVEERRFLAPHGLHGEKLPRGDLRDGRLRLGLQGQQPRGVRPEEAQEQGHREGGSLLPLHLHGAGPQRRNLQGGDREAELR